MIYTIYYIPGIKIGCTKRDVQKRVTEQGYIHYKVLEVHKDFYLASQRERELQKEYGLPLDDCMFHERDYSKIGRKGGKTRHSNMIKTGEWKQLQYKGNLISNQIQILKIQTCPYCNKTIKGLNYKRWHGKNCKSKK